MRSGSSFRAYHFEPKVQQGLICSNLQSTQNALAFLAKLQGFDHRQTCRSPRRNTNRGLPRDQNIARSRDRGDGVNVRYARQGDRQNRGFSDRTQQGEGGRTFIDVARAACGRIGIAS